MLLWRLAEVSETSTLAYLDSGRDFWMRTFCATRGRGVWRSLRVGGQVCAEGCEWVDGCASKVASGWMGGERRRLDFGSQFVGGRKRPVVEVEPHHSAHRGQIKERGLRWLLRLYSFLQQYQEFVSIAFLLSL